MVHQLHQPEAQACSAKLSSTGMLRARLRRRLTPAAGKQMPCVEGCLQVCNVFTALRTTQLVRSGADALFSTRAVTWPTLGCLAASVCARAQGFLDSALVVGSFHVIDHMGEEGLERAVGTRAAAVAANAARFPVLALSAAAVTELLTICRYAS